jgi:hypothetical protein
MSTCRAAPHGSSLAKRIKEIAARLRRDFAAYIAGDPKKFKREAVRYLKLYLPPGPGRPQEDAITTAIKLRKQRVNWKEIYAQCIPDHSKMLPAIRRLAEQNLRAARRSRLNAARRTRRREKKSPLGSFAEINSPPNVPSSPLQDSGLNVGE